jgi:glutamate synthase domain-containing protein 3
MVDLDAVESDDDLAELLEMIERHQIYTGSTVADRVLELWPEVATQFVKVMPVDYKRVLAERQSHDEERELLVREESPGTAFGG